MDPGRTEYWVLVTGSPKLVGCNTTTGGRLVDGFTSEGGAASCKVDDGLTEFQEWE